VVKQRYAGGFSDPGDCCKRKAHAIMRTRSVSVRTQDIPEGCTQLMMATMKSFLLCFSLPLRSGAQVYGCLIRVCWKSNKKAREGL